MIIIRVIIITKCFIITYSFEMKKKSALQTLYGLSVFEVFLHVCILIDECKIFWASLIRHAEVGGTFAKRTAYLKPLQLVRCNLSVLVRGGFGANGGLHIQNLKVLLK